MKPMFEIFVPGLPVGWAAPTVTKRGNTYKKKNLVEWQHIVGLTCQQKAPKTPYLGAIREEFTFHLPRGKSVKRDHHIVRPDLVNIVKAAEDAMHKKQFINKPIFKDDSQIVWSLNYKRYAINGRIGVDIILWGW